MAFEDRCSPQSAQSAEGIPHSPQKTAIVLVTNDTDSQNIYNNRYVQLFLAWQLDSFRHFTKKLGRFLILFEIDLKWIWCSSKWCLGIFIFLLKEYYERNRYTVFVEVCMCTPGITDFCMNYLSNSQEWTIYEISFEFHR